jgi:hypothetical protein
MMLVHAWSRVSLVGMEPGVPVGLDGSRCGGRSESLEDSGAPVGRFRMSLDIREEALTSAVLSEHAAISIAFVVDRVLEVRLLDGA